MPIPFATRWEVTSTWGGRGAFLEAARVRPANGSTPPAELWVERLLPGLADGPRQRVLRRWYLASRLTSVRWPRLLEVGEDDARPWAVLEGPAQAPWEALSSARPEQALREVRALALAVAEAETILEAACARTGLAVRPSVLGRTPGGRLMLHLAALDRTPEEGSPTPAEWRLVTPEALEGHPATARTNVFALGWILCLALTGRAPYEVSAEPSGGQGGGELLEALRPLVVGGRVRGLGLPGELRAAEPIIRRALSPKPQARYAGSAALAEALGELLPGASALDERSPGPTLVIPAPRWPVEDEQLPLALEARLLKQLDLPQSWLELADHLDDAQGVRSVRAALIRAHHVVDLPSATLHEKRDARQTLEALLKEPGVTPVLGTERLSLGWQLGYVRMLATRPAGALPPRAEAHLDALGALLQHPSLRFVQLISLNGPLDHARRWIEALQRHPPPGLRRVHLSAVPQTDSFAIDVAYRIPRWLWTWGKTRPPSLWTRLFSARG